MTEVEISSAERRESVKLATLVRQLHLQGHNPATSGNYSLRGSSAFCLISESGIDKSQFEEINLMPVSLTDGKPVAGSETRKASAETALHLAIYRMTQAKCVLHSHLLDSLLFADLYPGLRAIEVGGLELLKGLRGVRTHEVTIRIPCFENTQDMERLAGELKVVLDEPNLASGFLVRQHGLYVWGDSVEEAKRHLEVFEYIFKYYLRSKGRNS